MSEVSNKTAPPSTSKNPYTLWFVILSFLAPVVAAYYMYFFGDITSFMNNGEFINPYYEYNKLDMKRDGENFTAQELGDKWQVFMVVGSSCDETCQQRLINLRQINKAVKRPHKIHHAVVFTATPDAAFEQFMQAEMPHTIRLQADADKLADLVQYEGSVSQIYLSDPLGYVIMRFSHELTPKLVIKDLNRLF